MLKLHLHFIFMILIFVISIINALYIIGLEEANVFIRIMSVFVIFLMIFIAGFGKNTFLPFLGDCAFPVGLIPNEMYPSKTNFEIELDFDYPDGSKVIYWSAYPKENDKNFIHENPYDAYGDYKNSGIAIINNNKAKLHIYCPNKYKVPTGMVIDKHIHYRVALANNPILSEVKTVFIKC
jgi:hypothetical protein